VKMKTTLKKLLARGSWRRRKEPRGKGTRAAGVHGEDNLGQKRATVPSELGDAEQ
jgi:hypothetical protein